MWILVGENSPVSNRLLISLGSAAFHGAAASLILVPRVRTWKIVGSFVYALVSGVQLTALVLVSSFISGGGSFDADVSRAIAQSDVREALSYGERLLSASAVLWLLALVAVFALLFPRRPSPARAVHLVAFCCLLLSGSWSVYAGTVGALGPVIHHIAEYRKEMSTFQAILAERRAKPIENAASQFEGVIVVVIGESTSRHHMSRYGYMRPTTPRLDALGANLLTFTDTISAHSHTVPALAAALTSSGSTEQTEFFSEESVDIISLARAAGYETHWISNQNEFGLWDNPISAIAHQAEHTKFLSSTIGKSFRRSTHDDAALSLLQTAVNRSQAKRKLIVVHLFATHWPYCSNYPAQFQSFDGPLGDKFFGKAREPAGISCYDNGIAYVDSVLDRAIAILRSLQQPSALLYFSDHGEAPLLGTGHDSFRHSSYHVEVPMLLWANPIYGREYQTLQAAAHANLDRPYTTANLFHSLGQLLQIQHRSIDNSRSVLSASLRDQPRRAMGGAVTYDDWSASNDYRENTRINLGQLRRHRDSVWAHRINSLGALLESAHSFAGIETDLVYMDEQRCFHVFHPPAPDLSLSLRDMLLASARYPELKVWLDWKNPTKENLPGALKCLSELDEEFNLRPRVLVETASDATFDGIRSISAAGFRQVYYMPTDRIIACLRKCTPQEATALAEELRATIGSNGFSGLSFDWRTHAFIKQHLATWVVQKQLQLFSWDMSIDTAHDADATEAIEKRFSSLPLSALLVTFPSQFRI